MLIRKPEATPVSALPDRLEQLLAFYESNLQLEVFFLGRREIDKLVELLPTQGSLITALTELLTDLRLPQPLADALQKRLEAADALRESNKAALDQAMQDVTQELEQMNLARQRIRQARQLSKTMYQVDPGTSSRLQDWA
jgi:predicted nucleotidyltransferase